MSDILNTVWFVPIGTILLTILWLGLDYIQYETNIFEPGGD